MEGHAFIALKEGGGVMRGRSSGKTDPAAWRALHVELHDFGHPAVFGQAWPHLGRQRYTRRVTTLVGSRGGSTAASVSSAAPASTTPTATLSLSLVCLVAAMHTRASCQ